MASKSSVDVTTIPLDSVVWIPVGYELPPATSNFGFQFSPVVLPYQELPYQRPVTNFIKVPQMELTQTDNQVHGHLDTRRGIHERNTATKDTELRIPHPCDNVRSGRNCRQEDDNFKLPNCITSGQDKKRGLDIKGLSSNNTIWTKTEAVKKKVKRFLQSVEKEHSKGSLHGSASLDKIVNHIETEFSTVLDSEYNKLQNVPQMNWNFDLKLITNEEILPYSSYYTSSANSNIISSRESGSLICSRNIGETQGVTDEKYSNEDVERVPLMCSKYKGEPREIDVVSAEKFSNEDIGKTGSFCSTYGRNEDTFVPSAEKYGDCNTSRVTSACDIKHFEGLCHQNNTGPSSSSSITEMTDLSEASSRDDLTSESSASFHSWSNCSLATHSSISSVSLDSLIQTSCAINTLSQSSVSEDLKFCKQEVVSIVKDNSSDCSKKSLTGSCLTSMSTMAIANSSWDKRCKSGIIGTMFESSNSETNHRNTEHTGSALIGTSRGLTLKPTESADDNATAKKTCSNTRNNTGTAAIVRTVLQCPSAPKKRKYPLEREDMATSVCIGSSEHLIDSNPEVQGRKRVRRRLFEDDDRMSSGDDDMFVIPAILKKLFN